MKMNIRKTMRGLWIALILGTVAGGMTSCEMENVPCEICSDNYDRDGVFIGQTCTPVRCCEVYYPYDCSNQI